MSEISSRKKEHLEFAADERSQSGVSAGWEDIALVPESLPAVGPLHVDLSTTLYGHTLKAPFVIASMTGGHNDTVPVNEALAVAAQELGVAIGSGSQRAALRDPSLARTYEVIRETAPDAVVMANIGVCQLVKQDDADPLTRDEIETALGMLDAQFLIIHLNIVEEVIQPEGDARVANLMTAVSELTSWSPVPVMAKETGSGMSRATAGALVEAGVSLLDVGGAGGTSFARIEGQRAAARGDALGARLGATFADWGIPTASSVIETRDCGVPVIATGGIRSGLDAAKAIALGASAVGIGRPALTAALDGPAAAVTALSMFIEELRLAVVLSGSRDLDDLSSGRHVVMGRTLEWARQRGSA